MQHLHITLGQHRLLIVGHPDAMRRAQVGRREAGVRELERRISRVARKLARRKVEARDAGRTLTAREPYRATTTVKATELDLRIIYVPGLSCRRNVHFVSTDADFHNSSW